jgi:tRNA(fMet)-specific endonuclease VapC
LTQRHLLDTSVCVPLINGTDDRLRLTLLDHSPRSVVLCSVVKAELLFGAQASSRVAENLDRVSRFCRFFDSLPFDDEAAACYGSIRVQLKREGRLIGANDMLIAATALAAEVALVTRNLDEFRRVPGLAVEDWS